MSLPKIIVTGAKYEQVHEPTETEFAELLARVNASIEIWNRERPKNQRQVITAEVWPPMK